MGVSEVSSMQLGDSNIVAAMTRAVHNKAKVGVVRKGVAKS